ncbi:MAG: histidinol dehydrogenase [Myxococcota bacterium]
MTRLRRWSSWDGGALPGSADGAVDAATLAGARAIVDDVRARGESAVREYGVKFGDIGEVAPLVLERDALEAAFRELSPDDQALLVRVAARIRTFAEAQRAALRDIAVAVPGGQAGHTVAPVERAGCYAPGGRFPLPSSVLMTAVTARAAGVETVWVASPRPAAVTLAAAWVAGADAVLAVGGAQAIAALAYGAGAVPACDVVVGPGNRW